MTNPLRTLQEYGQSVWLDFLSRDLFRSGELKRLIAEDGLRGMTSNPSIFEKAIGHGEDYDAQIAELEAAGDLDPGALFERLAITDIQSAADALRPVYDQTQGRDGYVSIEVSPYLAMQTDATIDEARRLWREVGRDSLMVTRPATQPRLPAIQAMTAEGVNINITLLFSQKVYGEVAEAYISGLEEYVAKGGDPHKVASVASFFVSRIDTMVDEALDKKIAAAADPAEKARLKGLQGKIAIANAKLAYQMYQQIFRDERWQRLAQQGAQTQRRLWAGDTSLWTSTDEAQWLGWLNVVETELKDAGRLEAFAAEIKSAGFSDAVLLGMGGSSLGPEVLAQSFGASSGFPRLHVLDSTDPAQIRHLESTIDLERTLFIVSSKSRSTLEPNIFKQYFWERAKAALGEAGAAERFIAVTDPGSSLEKMAQADRFRAVFH